MGNCSKAIYPDESEAESEAKNVELDITATKSRFGDLALQHAAAAAPLSVQLVTSAPEAECCR